MSMLTPSTRDTEYRLRSLWCPVTRCGMVISVVKSLVPTVWVMVNFLRLIFFLGYVLEVILDVFKIAVQDSLCMVMLVRGMSMPMMFLLTFLVLLDLHLLECVPVPCKETNTYNSDKQC